MYYCCECYPLNLTLGGSLSMSRWSCYNTREYFLNLIKCKKTFNSKSSANLKLNDEILNAFPQIQEQRCPFSPLLFNPISEIFANSLPQQNKQKE